MTNQQKIDSKLFMKMYSLFEKMSRRGKETAVETLSYILGLDIVINEEIKRRNKKC